MKAIILILSSALLFQQKCDVNCTTVIKDQNGKEITVPIPCPPSPSPVSSPSVEPSPVPEPSSEPSPLPSPSPSPKPSPSSFPSPSPFPSPSIPIWCQIEVDGNFGEAPIDQCPQCWTDYAEANNVEIISRWGIEYRGERDCKGPKPDGDCGCKKVKNVDITPHSKKPFLAHRRASGGSETHKGCQPSNDSSMVPEIWVYPPNVVGGRCDPFSGDNYWCHHKAQVGQCGPTKFEVQHGAKASIIVNVP